MGREWPHSDTTECITRSDGAQNSQIHVFFEVPYWEQEICGIRYGGAADRPAWFRAIARKSEELEPYIGDFARFEDAAGKDVHLPFADGTFDIAYSWGVRHHTPNTEQAYREIHRVLKPSGIMRSVVYHVNSWTYLMRGLAKGRPYRGVTRRCFEKLESPCTKH
jgi:SAM-dependent methyltransferase